MLHPLVGLTLGASFANAAAIRSSGCQVHLTASGAIQGPLGTISSGQVRAGGGVESTTFTLNNGGMMDSQGRGCWWTPPTHVLQCDVEQTPDTGFRVGCDGSVSYNGQMTFYECETGEKGQYNVYLEPCKGVNCNKVHLSADGCKPQSCEKPKPLPPPPPPPPPATKGCPANLAGDYEFPHLIIPVDKSKPDQAAGTSYFGQVSSSVSSLFNFDVPSSDAGKTCSLLFLFPKQSNLETSSFTFSGSGSLDFASLSSPAQSSTTYGNMPSKKDDYGSRTVAPGNSYVVATFDCPAGQTVGFKISAGDDTSFKYFQDYNPSPIGLYIRVC